MTMTTADGDRAARTTWRQKIRSPLVVVIVALIVALVAVQLHVATVEKELQWTRIAWAANCEMAESTAIGGLHTAVREGRYVRARNPGAEPPLSAAGPGNALAVYIWACAPHSDHGTLDMAKRISELTFALMSTQNLDALEYMEVQLEATPLVKWKSLDLPPDPWLFLRRPRGDKQKADDIEREAVLGRLEQEAERKAKAAVDGRDAGTLEEHAR